MRIAVTGKDGQVVRSLVERGASSSHEIVPIGRPQLDLLRGAEEILAALKTARPDVIVSAAAYTAVDKAETDRKMAFAVNQVGAGAVAAAAHRLGIPLIHLSTDYVFDGAKSEPYVESDPTGPTGVYGESKLAGEQAVLAAHDNVAILRTAWVYSPFGNNFAKTMLRLANDSDEVAVVGDQYGNPTSALDIADGIVAIAASLVGGKAPDQRGIFHMAGSGDTNWAEFAEAIFAASARLGGRSACVRPIATSDYPTAAKRPANSRLNGKRLAQAHGVQLPDWRESINSIVERLIQDDPPSA